MDEYIVDKNTKRTKRQWLAYAGARIKKGCPASSLIEELTNAGWDEKETIEIINNLKIKNQSQSIGWIVFGVFLIVIGLGVTSITYESACHVGGLYVIWYGPVIFGLYCLIYGAIRMFRADE